MRPMSETRTRRTRVVNLRHGLPYDVYIGRPSRWGNTFSHRAQAQAPFRVATREQAIARYRRQLWSDIRGGRISLEELAALSGKTLACWCKPAPCHGDVLAAAADWAAEQLALRT
jgi:hypothetical protein